MKFGPKGGASKGFREALAKSRPKASGKTAIGHGGAWVCSHAPSCLSRTEHAERQRSKPCRDCGQPMLPPGVEKRPNEYDHASGCPSAPLCGAYMGDNDATCPQLTCIRQKGHEPPCDNVRGDDEDDEDEERDPVNGQLVAATVGRRVNGKIDPPCGDDLGGDLERAFWRFDALHKAHYRSVDPKLPGPLDEREAFKRASGEARADLRGLADNLEARAQKAEAALTEIRQRCRARRSDDRFANALAQLVTDTLDGDA